MPKRMSAETRAKLLARGLDPDATYDDLLKDAERMQFEIRHGLWDLDLPRRVCSGCGCRLDERTKGCATCAGRLDSRRARQ